MPLERGFLLPSVKLAVLAESDVTGRRRAHRRAKPRKAAAQGFFDDLKAGDHGAVVNVISVGAFLFGAYTSMYAAGKGGLLSMPRYMATEFAPLGIRVNALAPGSVDTDMVRRNSAEAQAVMTGIQLMRRMAHPDEMVGPALMLTSDAGSFITGHVVFADGGMVPH